MSYTIQFPSDEEDGTLPEGFMRNAGGQVVQVSFCCRNFADGYDCNCNDW
jgi:hypothetical protein